MSQNRSTAPWENTLPSLPEQDSEEIPLKIVLEASGDFNLSAEETPSLSDSFSSTDRENMAADNTPRQSGTLQRQNPADDMRTAANHASQDQDDPLYDEPPGEGRYLNMTNRNNAF